MTRTITFELAALLIFGVLILMKIQQGNPFLTFHTSPSLKMREFWQNIYSHTLPPKGGMQDWKLSQNMYTLRTYIFVHLAPTCMLSRCLVTKSLHRSSGGSLSRVWCWLGITTKEKKERKWHSTLLKYLSFSERSPAEANVLSDPRKSQMREDAPGCKHLLIYNRYST